MSKAEDALRARGIVNGGDVIKRAVAAGLTPVMLSFTPELTGRGYRPARWAVVHAEEKTDPGGHWMDYGLKVFAPYWHKGTTAEKRAAAREDAIAWTNEKYGTTTWAAIPGLRGYLFPTEVVNYIKEKS
jgi:hypothetical protein